MCLLPENWPSCRLLGSAGAEGHLGTCRGSVPSVGAGLRPRSYHNPTPGGTLLGRRVAERRAQGTGTQGTGRTSGCPPSEPQDVQTFLV